MRQMMFLSVSQDSEILSRSHCVLTRSLFHKTHHEVGSDGPVFGHVAAGESVPHRVRHEYAREAIVLGVLHVVAVRLVCRVR